MPTWLIRWIDRNGDPGSRTIPRLDSGVDVFAACRLAARLYDEVYFTALDDHGRPERITDGGQALWTRVTASSHDIDVILLT